MPGPVDSRDQFATMRTKTSNVTSGVVDPSAEEVRACFEIERSFNPRIPEPDKKGFFLEGITLNEYVGFSTDAHFRVMRIAGCLAGFIIALPPSHPRLENLKQSPAFELDDVKVLQDPKLVWIAKVATQYEFRRQGIAASLYQNLIDSYSDSAMITTTVGAPIVNQPSEAFHQSQGFRKIGIMPLGDRGELKGCICNVYYRPPAAR